MEKPIIKVRNVSKEYILSHRLPYQTFRDTITDLAKKPFRLLQGQGKTKKEEFWALQDINFDIQKGESIGLIGANGSGKSTLLKILSQITAPTTGEITLRGRIASLLEVGTGFHPELTGRENIFLNGTILGMTKKEIFKKFDEIIQFSGVEKFLDTPAKRYSSGMLVRLAFSVAAHLDSEILLIDEVLAVGDSEFQKKSLSKMNEITRDAGRTIIFVSHNMEAIKRLCTKCILLKSGSLEMFDQTNKVVEKYLALSNYQSNTPLSQRNDRMGSGKVKFTSITITNLKGNKNIYSGDKLKISLQYESDFRDKIPFARILITVINANQQPVLRFDSAVTADTFVEDLDSRGKIVCESEEVHLIEGRYFVSVNFWKNDTDTSEDNVEMAGEFNVITNNEDYNYHLNADKTISDYLIKYSFKQENKHKI